MLLYRKCEAAHSGVQLMQSYAAFLRTAGATPADNVAARITNMREASTGPIAFILAAGPKAAINPILNTFISGWGADPYAQLQAVQTAFGPFMTAANALKANLGDIVDWTSSGVVWVTVSPAQLAGLYPSLDALIAALTPLNTAG
jgi:hypothetical protein